MEPSAKLDEMVQYAATAYQAMDATDKNLPVTDTTSKIPDNTGMFVKCGHPETPVSLLYTSNRRWGRSGEFVH